MMAFESAFAGLPPSYIERSKLDAEKLFVQSNGTVLQEAKDTYLQDTDRFQSAISKFSSQMSTHGPYSRDLSFPTIAEHMNSASRAEKFLNHIHSAISGKNTKYLDNLTRGINWGINSMFRSADIPQTASSRPEIDEMNWAYDSMIATINLLGDGDHFSLPDKHFELPQTHSNYKSDLVARSGESCEATGGVFIEKAATSKASNCIAAHIIPKSICLLSDRGSGVFAWLVLALILSPEQFRTVWNECSAQDANQPGNLLLLLDEIEFVYDQAHFRLFYSNPNYAICPLLRCDYSNAVQSGGSLTMCFDWLIEEPYQRNYWPAKRIKRSEDGSKSVTPPMDQPAFIRPEPTGIDYANFSSAVPNPSPILLDAHNMMASLHHYLRPYRKPGRHEYPVAGNTLWKTFIRPETQEGKSGSRQRSRRSDRTSFIGSGSIHSPRGRNRAARGHRALDSDRSDHSVSLRRSDRSSSLGTDLDFDGDGADICQERPTLEANPDATGPANTSNFQQAIDEYLERKGMVGVDRKYHGDVPHADGEPSYDDFLRYNAFIPAWRNGIVQ
jgi:hypothetical protein